LKIFAIVIDSQEQYYKSAQRPAGFRSLPDGGYNRTMPIGKRVFDIVFSLLLLIALAPLIALIAFLVRVFLGPPILFRQERPGYKGRPFLLYKFRTMTNASDPTGNLLPDSARLTRLGRFLRALSLDELPELFNILRGDMSFVGPRPLLMEYLPLYSPEQARRHDAFPGLTGWAQVNGRNALTWQDRFELDVWYVDHWSFRLDIKIILTTIWKVLRREGINQPGQATMERFAGNEETRFPK
jgi:lipopolysaccharide/colanic/teichoic acid biosynthesis glycosyltransferase